MWHEARRSKQKVHDMMDAARKRAQRRAVYLAKRRGDPQQSIQLHGSRCRMYRDDALYHASEYQQGLYVSLSSLRKASFVFIRSFFTACIYFLFACFDRKNFRIPSRFCFFLVNWHFINQTKQYSNQGKTPAKTNINNSSYKGLNLDKRKTTL